MISEKRLVRLGIIPSGAKDPNTQRGRVYHFLGLAPVVLTFDYALVQIEIDPPKKPPDSVLQIGNLLTGAKFSNPNRGRIYDPRGLSPTIVNFAAGGGREAKFLIEYA